MSPEQERIDAARARDRAYEREQMMLAARETGPDGLPADASPLFRFCAGLVRAQAALYKEA